MGTRVPTIYVLSKNKKKYQKFSAENFSFFTAKNLCLSHGQVFTMLSHVHGYIRVVLQSLGVSSADLQLALQPLDNGHGQKSVSKFIHDLVLVKNSC